MFKVYNAYTRRSDNPQKAAEEIVSQLEDIKLLKNTVGIVTCATYYIASGAYSAVCKSLPFDIVGISTVSFAINGFVGETMFGLTVITSDICSFGVGMCEYTTDEACNAAVKQAVTNGLKSLGGVKPAIAFGFLPPIQKHGKTITHQYTTIPAFSEACPGIPLFGSVASDDNTEVGADAACLFKGEIHQHGCCFLFLGGDDFSFKFFHDCVTDSGKLPYSGEITKTNGPVVLEINDEPAAEYFRSNGFCLPSGELDPNVKFTPAVINCERIPALSSMPPVVCFFFCLRPDDSFECLGFAPEGGRFRLYQAEATMCGEVTAKHMNDVAAFVAETPGKHFVFNINCIVRRFTLGKDTDRDFKYIAEKIGESAPFLSIYSAGEVCPVNVGGALRNHLHLMTLSTCVVTANP